MAITLTRTAKAYGKTLTEFLQQPIADIALDVEALRAEQEDERKQTEEARMKQGGGSRTPPKWRG